MFGGALCGGGFLCGGRDSSIESRVGWDGWRT